MTIPNMHIDYYLPRRNKLALLLLALVAVVIVPIYAAHSEIEQKGSEQQVHETEDETEPSLRERWKQKKKAERSMYEKHEGRRRKDAHSRGDGDGPRAGRGRFMRYVDNYFTAVQDPYRAAALSILGLKHHYKKQGKPLEITPLLEEQLQLTKDQKMRNILLFSLRQVYEQHDQTEKFLDISRQILRENVAQASK